MRRILMLLVLGVAPAWAQGGRRALEAGNARYQLADFRGAVPLLSAGLDPAPGRGAAWSGGVQRLADALLVLHQDSLAATWLRWAIRLAPEFAVDEDVMPPAVVRAAQAARAYVEATRPDRFGSATTFRWPAAPGAATEGTVRLAPADVPLSARVGENQFLQGGESRRLPPGSYPLVVSAPGFLPFRFTIEVLPGVTTTVKVPLLPETSGSLSVTAHPWTVLSIDDERIGYTPIAGHRLAPGIHLVHLEAPGGESKDIPVGIPEGGQVGVSWVTAWERTGDPRFDGALTALDSAQIERAGQLLRSLLDADPPLTTGRTLALVRLAEASWGLGERDSARAHLRRLVESDPFYLPSPGTLNPDLQAAYWAIRRRTLAVALRAPSDTVLDPAMVMRRLSQPDAGSALPVKVAVGQPGVVRLYLRFRDPQPRDSLLAVLAVDSVADTALTLVTPDGSRLGPGTYTLEGEVTSSGGSARGLLQLVVEPLPADTAAHLGPIPPDHLLPETKRAWPAPRTILRGLALGALAMAVPIVLNDADLSGRWMPPAAALIGGSVALASIVSSLPRAPIPEYVASNGWRRERWDQANRRIAAENAAKRQRVAVRIRTMRVP